MELLSHDSKKLSDNFMTPKTSISDKFITPKTSKSDNFITPKSSLSSDFITPKTSPVLNQRDRTYSILIPPNDIIESSAIIKKPSLEAQHQKNAEICFAHTTARIIVRFMAKIIPTILKYKNDFDKNPDCYIIDADITDIKFILTKNKCTNKNRYNHLVIYYYILVFITNKYGCDGSITDIILQDFVDTGFLTSDTVITKGIDNKATTIIQTFNKAIVKKRLSYAVRIDIFDINNNKSYRKNWITDFPENAKKALKEGQYIIMDFYLPVNQWELITDVFNVSRTTTCVPPISGHSVVITNWEIDPYTQLETVTILNSWGKQWGNDGMVKINALNYDKFAINHTCNNKEPIRFKYFILSHNSKGRKSKSKKILKKLKTLKKLKK